MQRSLKIYFFHLQEVITMAFRKISLATFLHQYFFVLYRFHKLYPLSIQFQLRRSALITQWVGLLHIAVLRLRYIRIVVRLEVLRLKFGQLKHIPRYQRYSNAMLLPTFFLELRLSNICKRKYDSFVGSGFRSFGSVFHFHTGVRGCVLKIFKIEN